MVQFFVHWFCGGLFQKSVSLVPLLSEDLIFLPF